MIAFDHSEALDANEQQEIWTGLQATPRQLPSRLFYDETGSQLFEKICHLEEYYPTRTEAQILHAAMPDIRDFLGGGLQLIEFGSGSSEKTRLLLHSLDVVAYVPIDISPTALTVASLKLQRAFPDLPLWPLCLDYLRPFRLPRGLAPQGRRRLLFFPGSTIGNLEREVALVLLQRMQGLVGREGAILIGVDLKKDRAVLEAAYNDREGVTAAFNRNLLVHLNRIADGNFNPQAFQHRAIYNETQGRIEMYLISDRLQKVVLGERSFLLKAGEPILTEYSHKYTLEGFSALARNAGLRVQQVWTDPQQWFAVFGLVSSFS